MKQLGGHMKTGKYAAIVAAISLCFSSSIDAVAQSDDGHSHRDPLFAKYPSGPVYHGPVQLPRFKDRDRAFVDYRTRIRNGMRQGANFAGHYALIGYGCGMFCQIYVVGDVITGQMFEFAPSGEEYYDLKIDFREDSSLILASWADDAGASVSNCMEQKFQWNGTKTVPLGKPIVVKTSQYGLDCDE